MACSTSTAGRGTDILNALPKDLSGLDRRAAQAGVVHGTTRAISEVYNLSDARLRLGLV